jgi:type IV pilus assembly protein PilY1
MIAVHPANLKRYVLLGTGQLLASADVTSSQVQTFYAIIDGTAGAFKTVTTPTTRTNLKAVTDVTKGVTVPAGFNGWYYDLPAGSRVVSEAVTYNGIVAFSALAMSSDPCSPQGSSDVYALNYATGVSVLNPTSTSSGTPAPFAAFSTSVNGIQFVSNNGTVELIVGTSASTSASTNSGSSGSSGSGTNGSGSSTSTAPIYAPPGTYSNTPATRLLNWREIPTAE